MVSKTITSWAELSAAPERWKIFKILFGKRKCYYSFYKFLYAYLAFNKMFQTSKRDDREGGKTVETDLPLTAIQGVI